MHENSTYTQQRHQLLSQSLFKWPGLQVWSFYFLVKVGLVIADVISLNLVFNFALIAALVVPLDFKTLRVLRQLIAIPAAIALLYSESFLPPFDRLLAQWDQVSAFSSNYLFELLTRAIKIEYIAALLVAWIAFVYLSRFLRMTAIAVIAIGIAGLSHAPASLEQPVLNAAGETMVTDQGAMLIQNATPDQALSAFYQEQLQFKLNPPTQVSPEFDILVVSICSLSWEDLEQSNLLDHPLMKSTQILLENYNSATSYSGPAALRLLRANCGHAPHERLFEHSSQCQLSNQLAKLGYSTDMLLNHSGEYDDFSGLLKRFGGLTHTAHGNDIPVIMTGFDDTAIYSDYALLNEWLAVSTDQPRFTFYNSLSLHDGNYVDGFSGNSMASYQLRARRLLDALYRLQLDIQASNKRVLMVIVPEHGANLKGDKIQLPGLREIPTRSLTHVPVLISLFGDNINPTTIKQQVVRRATGPSAISSALYAIQEQQPFSGGQYNPSEVAELLPSTPWVAENKDIKVMEYNNQFILKIKEQAWLPYQ